MGRYFGNSRMEMGFPDEFGEDICPAREDRAQGAPPPSGPALPFCGYVTLNWFGPYLLSPQRRRERGCC